MWLMQFAQFAYSYNGNMAVNLVLPEKKKRIRHTIPTYKKIYTVYQYDRVKFVRIFKKIQALAYKYGRHIFDNTNPYKVLQLCYLRDENGNLQHIGDEKHIYRYRTLQNVLKEIADYLFIAYELENNSNVLKYLFKRTHIIVFTQENEQQAELFEAYRMPLKARLKIHITLLRYLQKGYEIEEAVRLTKEKYELREE